MRRLALLIGGAFIVLLAGKEIVGVFLFRLQRAEPVADMGHVLGRHYIPLFGVGVFFLIAAMGIVAHKSLTVKQEGAAWATMLVAGLLIGVFVISAPSFFRCRHDINMVLGIKREYLTRAELLLGPGRGWRRLAVTNPSDVTYLLQAFRTAEERLDVRGSVPQNPSTAPQGLSSGSVFLIFTTRDGEQYGCRISGFPNGVVGLAFGSNIPPGVRPTCLLGTSSWKYGYYQADAVGPVIERIMAAQRPVQARKRTKAGIEGGSKRSEPVQGRTPPPREGSDDED